MNGLFDPANGEVYVDNSLSSNISVLDGQTDSLLTTIAVGDQPQDPALDPSNGEIYVPDYLSESVSVISTTSNTVLTTLSVGSGPQGATYDPANGDVYVNDAGSSQVSVISTSSNTVIDTIPVGDVPSVRPTYDPSNGDLYVTNQGSGNLSVISGSTNTVVATVPLQGTNNHEAALDSGTGDLYVSNQADGSVSVVDGANNSVVATIPVGANPIDAAYDPFTGSLYVPTIYDDYVDWINASSELWAGTFTLTGQPGYAIYDPVDTLVWETSNDGSLEGISGFSEALVAIVGLPASSTGTPIVDTTNGNLFVPIVGADQVSIVNGGNATPFQASLSALPDPAGVGQGVQFAAHVAGGPCPCTYAWAFGDTGTSAAQNPTHAYSATGTYTVELTATSHTGQTDTVWTNITVTSVSPLAVALSASPTSVSVGSSSVLTATVSGGVSPYSYVWSGLPTGCVSSNSSTLDCTPTAAGAYQPEVAVHDSDGHEATAETYLNATSVEPLTVSLSASPSTVTVGSTSVLTATASGGVPAYTYSWSDLPAGCSPSTSSVLDCTPSTAGSYQPKVTVDDSDEHAASAETYLNATAAAGTLTASLKLSSSSVTVGESVTLTTTVSGGTSPYSYSWPSLPGGCTSGNEATLSCTPTSVGSTEIEVRVADSASHQATAYANLTVTPASGPVVEAVAISPNLPSLSPGASLAFTATATCDQGGCPSSGVTFTWSLSNDVGNLSSLTGASVTFTAGAGQGSTVLTVRASLNSVSVTTETTVTVTLAPPPKSSGFSLFGLSTDLSYLVVVGLLLLIVLIAAVALRSSRTSHRLERPSQPPEVRPSATPAARLPEPMAVGGSSAVAQPPAVPSGLASGPSAASSTTYAQPAPYNPPSSPSSGSPAWPSGFDTSWPPARSEEMAAPAASTAGSAAPPSPPEVVEVEGVDSEGFDKRSSGDSPDAGPHARERREEVERGLSEVLRGPSGGVPLVQDPRRLRALLSDTCPGATREIELLLRAQKAGITDEILEVRSRGSSSPARGLISRRLTRRMVAETETAEPAARWAVEAWMTVLLDPRLDEHGAS